MPHTVLQGDIYNVTIDSVQYSRKELLYTLDATGETLTVVHSGSTLIDAAGYADITPDGEGSPFASYAIMAAWVYDHIRYIAVLEIGEFNTVTIDGSEYFRNTMSVTLNSEAGTATVVDNGTPVYTGLLWSDMVVLVEAAYTPFANYAAMAAWYAANVIFAGHTIGKKRFRECVLIDGKPYPFGLYLVWDDAAETLEVRHGHYDYDNKPLPPTHYSRIVIAEQPAAIASYQELITAVTDIFFNTNTDITNE